MMLLFLLPVSSYAITQQEAEAVLDTVFTRSFQTHYLHHVLFYDGSSFREAYVAVRSGSVAAGGCGYTLTSTSVGVTFDVLTDSLGAAGEGMTVFLMRPENYPSIDSARNTIELFLYENITGLATIPEPSVRRQPVAVYPNPARNTLWIAGEKNDELVVVNILGHIVFSRRFHQTEIFQWNLSLATGRYFYFIRKKTHTVRGQFIRMRP